MFHISMNGTKANVKRTLTLPGKGDLPQLDLEDRYTIQLDLGGVDPKSPTGKDILKTFPKVYGNELNAVRNRYDDPCIKIWLDAGKLASDGAAEPGKMEKAAAKAEADIVKTWNEFNAKKAKPLAGTILQHVAKGAAKRAKEQVADTRVAFSSGDLKEKRVGILTAILSAVTIGAVASGLGWLAAALAGVAALTQGYRNAWEIGKKRSLDAQVNLNQIDDGLSDALATLKKLEPNLTRLVAAQNEASANIVAAKQQLNKMKSELETLEKRAKKEKAVAEAKHLGEMRTEMAKQEAKVQALLSSAEKMDSLGKAVRDATKAVETAGALVKAKRGKWDSLMAAYVKVSKDGDAMLSSMAKLLKSWS